MLAMLAGCTPSPPDPRQVIREDNFEGPAPAGAPIGLYTHEQAHSWTQALKVGQEAEYGTLTSGTWDALGRPHHLRIRLWARLSAAPLNRANLEIVVRRPGASAEQPAQNIGAQTFNLCEVVRRYQQWVPGAFFVSLPRNLRPTDEVVIFIWVRPGVDAPIYVDDFSLENLD